MEPDQSVPIPQRPVDGETQPVAEVMHHAHTFKDDMAEAMNETEAPVVQALLNDAREREAFAKEENIEHAERKWYSVSSLFFIVLTLAVIGYGTYYYMHLTVKVQPTQSVGVFSSTPIIVASNMQQLQTTLNALALPVGKPTLVNLATNSQSNILLTNSQLYNFIGAGAISEPLQAVVSVARLGVYNTGKTIEPFIIMSVPDSVKASQEFGIAEPTLLKLFGPAMGIDLASVQDIAGQTFQSQYFYNLPVRTVSTVASTTTPSQRIFLYGYANDNTLVITTDPQVLKAVYDSVINQH
jgi:hypothetical protein